MKAATNAAGAAAIALELGVAVRRGRRARSRGFGGVARRFQYRGERDGVTFVDDYAHLPTEVAAAIATARAGRWRRVIAVFQPHRYTRTASLWRDFADAFDGADAVVLTDVYAAGETPIPGVSRPARRCTRSLDRHPDARRSRTCRGAPTSSTSRAASRARATSCSRSAPATSPRCPTSGSAS